MKTRKQQSLVKKRARAAAARRSAARSQAAAPRRKGAANGKVASRGKSASRRMGNGKAAAGTPSKSRTHEDGALTLGAECTVAEADSLKAALASRLAGPEPVTVDVSALQRVDTAGLQLLAAFVRDRRTAGRTVQWRGRASALEAAAGLLGLKDMLELADEVGR
ncbi:MAG: STAS domain-containing protein [Steroidobacteraceae bacterium]